MGNKRIAASQIATKYSDGLKEEHLKWLAPISGLSSTSLVPLSKAIQPLIPLLKNVEAYGHAAAIRAKDTKSHLTLDEAASILLYTMSWEPDSTSLYFVMNAALRSEERTKLKPWFQYLKLTLTALLKLPAIKGILYRGIKTDLSKGYSVGATVVWWGFSSCTKSVNVLENDVFMGKTGARTLFTIDCTSARDIKECSYYGNEDEMVLLPATQFRVTGCLNSGNGLMIIQLVVIVGEHSMLDEEFITTYENQLHASSQPNETATLNLSLEPAGKHIMLSYATADDNLANTITVELETKGYTVWTFDAIDPFDVVQDLAQAVDDAWVFICIVTPSYQNSNKCRDPLLYTKDKRKKIIPIKAIPNWKPTGWLDFSLTNMQLLNWELVQPIDIPRKMPALLLRLRTLTSGVKPTPREIRAAQRGETTAVANASTSSGNQTQILTRATTTTIRKVQGNYED